VSPTRRDIHTIFFNAWPNDNTAAGRNTRGDPDPVYYNMDFQAASAAAVAARAAAAQAAAQAAQQVVANQAAQQPAAVRPAPPAAVGGPPAPMQVDGDAQ
jgi:hypothetical protein